MKDNITPPWVQYPTYEAGCMGFRMGLAEDYFDRWTAHWNSLDNEARQDIKATAPEGWKGHLST